MVPSALVSWISQPSQSSTVNVSVVRAAAARSSLTTPVAAPPVAAGKSVAASSAAAMTDLPKMVVLVFMFSPCRWLSLSGRAFVRKGCIRLADGEDGPDGVEDLQLGIGASRQTAGLSVRLKTEFNRGAALKVRPNG